MLNKLTKIKRLLLIGKEIWHNKRSMRGRFIIYLLSLVLLAGSAMLILLKLPYVMGCLILWRFVMLFTFQPGLHS